MNLLSPLAMKYQSTVAVAGTSFFILQEMHLILKPLLATASVSDSTSTQAEWHRPAGEESTGKDARFLGYTNEERRSEVTTKSGGNS